MQGVQTYLRSSTTTLGSFFLNKALVVSCKHLQQRQQCQQVCTRLNRRQSLGCRSDLADLGEDPVGKGRRVLVCQQLVIVAAFAKRTEMQTRTCGEPEIRSSTQTHSPGATFPRGFQEGTREPWPGDEAQYCQGEAV